MSSVELHEHRLDDLETKIKGLEEREKSYVTYEHFYWIIGVLMTISIGINAFTYQAISDAREDIGDIRKDTSQTNQSVSQIQGKLEPYDIEFKK